MKTHSSVQPLVSVVIPCYNHEGYVKECINSVIDQDYNNIELIVIDDGSTDNSVEKIKELIGICEQRFVRFEFRTRPNCGLCETLNEAVEWARGDFYSAIASDDLMLPEKTSSQVRYLLGHESCVALFSGVEIINAEGSRVRGVPGTNKSYTFKDVFLGRCSLPAPTLMLRLHELKKTGGYPSRLHIEDWYMWLKLTEAGGYVHNMGGIVAGYRRHDTNISSQLEKMQKARVQIVNMFASHPLYKRAMANTFVQSAIDIQLSDGAQSLSFLRTACKWSLRDLIQVKVAKYIIKALIPKKVLKMYFLGKV